VLIIDIRLVLVDSDVEGCQVVIGQDCQELEHDRWVGDEQVQHRCGGCHGTKAGQA